MHLKLSIGYWWIPALFILYPWHIVSPLSSSLLHHHRKTTLPYFWKSTRKQNTFSCHQLQCHKSKYIHICYGPKLLYKQPPEELPLYIPQLSCHCVYNQLHNVIGECIAVEMKSKMCRNSIVVFIPLDILLVRSTSYL